MQLKKQKINKLNNQKNTSSSSYNIASKKKNLISYSSLPNRRYVTAVNFLRIFHPQMLFQPPLVLKMAQTSHDHAYSRQHVY